MERINILLDRYFKVVALGLVVLVSLLGIQFLLLPQYNILQQSGVLQYQQVKTTLANRQAYVEQLKTMDQNYQQLDQRMLRTVDNILPSDFSDVDLFTELSQLFQQTNLSVQSINIASTSGSGAATAAATTTTKTATPAATVSSTYDILQVTVNVSAGTTATYGDFKNLLVKLENYPHLINIDSMTYAPGKTAYTLIFTTYRRKAAATL